MTCDPSKDFPPFSEAGLLVHITFHVAPHRLRFLRQVLDAAETYRFRSVDVVVDANADHPVLAALTGRRDDVVAIQTDIHPGLEDPHRLAWCHRAHVGAMCDAYDYFMYVEDDVLVSAAALTRWREDSMRLAPHGYRRGFLRVETTPGGVRVCTDQKRPAHRRRLRRLGPATFLALPNPYCACWLYSRSQLRQFMAMPIWDPRLNTAFATREAAACGMISDPRGDHRVLIPVNGDESIPDQAFINHLPNNYAADASTRFGSLPVHKLLRRGLVRRSVERAALQLRLGVPAGA